MMRRIDAFIDQTTMYRLLLYVLAVYLAFGLLLASTGRLAFSPVRLIVSIALLAGLCWAANTILAAIFKVPANVESSLLTALILALIFDPPATRGDLTVLGWAAILAMASKYILALYGKHVFNPAAIAAVIIGFAVKDPASWWVGTAGMLPVVLIGGLVIVRKVRQETLVASFVGAAVIGELAASRLSGAPAGTELRRLVVESPLLFLGSIMLTEPLTAPPTRALRTIYGLMIGILFVPQVHLGSLYSTPELALVAGNAYSYLVSPKRRFQLELRRKTRMSPDTVNFAFATPQPLAYEPGQYMEWTLGLPRADRRGNRRFFTLASSPTERALHLGVRFYNESSSFKQALLAMNRHGTIIAGQVAGDFTLPQDPARKLVFIAGGIGITPFRSMLKYLIDTGQPRDIIVFYANRTIDDIVYRDVLDEARLKLGIPTIYTLTDASTVPGKWTGYVGRIDPEMIAREVPDYRERTFYLSGPPEMVRAYERMLKSLQVGGRQIKKDFFAGLV